MGLTHANQTSFKKGMVPWNKGIKQWDNNHPFQGKHHSEETRTTLSNKSKGNSNAKGYKHTEEAKISMSITRTGKPSPKKGKKYIAISQDRKDDYRMRRLFRVRLQKDILKRDNYTCQLCGTMGGDLQVDHIQSWKDYVELRFSIDNCRTLCVDCHYKITFGKPKPASLKGWGHNLFKGGTQA